MTNQNVDKINNEQTNKEISGLRILNNNSNSKYKFNG